MSDTPTHAYVFGYGNRGALGTGSTARALQPFAVELPGGIARLAGGNGFTLALTNHGTVWAWGDNRKGQLGTGDRRSHVGRFVKVAVPGRRRVIRIDAADDHAIAVTDDGRVYSWGGNSLGQLGDGSTQDRSQPKMVRLPGARPVGVAAGADHMLVLTSAGQVFGWGDNAHGQLGAGADRAQREPTRVLLPAGVRPVALAAGDTHSVILTHDGRVASLGQLVDTHRLASPEQARTATISGERVIAIDAGRGHTLALTRAGHLYAWGDNSVGQLGDGSGLDHDKPVRVQVPGTVTRAVTGGSHCLALDRGGRVWTWGTNRYGQLGIGSTTDGPRPAHLTTLAKASITTIAAADHHSMITVKRHLAAR